MIDPRLKNHIRIQETRDNVRSSRQSTGISTERLSRLTPSWSDTYIGEAKVGRPSNDSSKVVHVDTPLISPRSGMYSARSRGSQSMTDHRHPQLDEIHEGHLAESILAQGTDRYVDLTVKDGFFYVCTSKTPQDFIQSRTFQMSIATGIPFPILVKETARDYIKYGNWYWVKARTAKSDVVVGGRSLTPANKLSRSGRIQDTPIGGYYRAQPRHMFPVYDKDSGQLSSWEQRVPGRQPKGFHLEDVIHGAYKPEAGDVLGNPQSGPVIEDIKTLRDIEEVVAKMLFKHSTPFIHHAVPDHTGTGTGTDEDIANAAASWDNVAADGMIVTGAGHVVTVVETKIGTIDSSPYLKYFLQRVLMGLNLSESIMGIGTVGAGTSDMLTAQMHDRVKSLQNDLETVIDYQVILELLVEAGFDPIRRESDRVHIRFTEVEIDTEIKLQNFYLNQYMNNAIDEDELRKALNRNPFTDAQRKQTFLYNVKLPLIEAQGDLSSDDQKGVMTHGNKLAKDLATHNHQLTLKAQAAQAALQPATATVTKKDTKASGASTTTAVKHVIPTKVGSTAAAKGLSPTGTRSSPDGGGATRTTTSTNNPVNGHGARGGPRVGAGSGTPADKK